MLTNEKKRDSAHTHSGVRVVSDNGHVVIVVRIVQCYHTITANSEHVVIGVRIVTCYCEGGVDVVGVLTPLRGGAQVVLHGDQVVELSVLLGVHEKEEVERGR